MILLIVEEINATFSFRQIFIIFVAAYAIIILTLLLTFQTHFFIF